MVDKKLMYRYWGKARPKTATGAQYHLLAYHSLDVAAVGKVFLEQHHKLRRTLATGLGLDDDTFLAWCLFFLAIHDLGKFAEGFQNLDRNLFAKLQQRTSDKPYSVRHDSLGFLLWERLLWSVLVDEDWLGLDAAVRDRSQWKRGLAFWARAFTGHHGQPPRRLDNNVMNHFTADDQEATMAFARAVRELLLPIENFQPPSAKAFKTASRKLSWWLAGVAVLADWIGSNSDYFPYEEALVPLPDYWQRAQNNAVDAMAKTGVLPSPVAQGYSLATLFPKLKDSQPTPLQRQVGDLELGDGPQLFILEDVTGAGKTEAAVLMAHRLMGATLGSGIYIGLPTMATANAMYDRMATVYDHLYTSEARPSLVLAHGARHLSDRFRSSILPRDVPPDTDYAQDEQSATARCAAWLADNRKQALLAAMGVGTLDQALLSILYSKHQSLRLLGLFDKVLVVDEVHANDAYMHQLLKVLLTFHGAMGGSVILLSATLPQRMRCELAEAFCTGVGRIPPTLQNQHYPLLTHIGGSGSVEQEVDTRPEVARHVAVRWLSTLEDVIKTLLQAAGEGRCVCWIRNTVADARDAYTILLNEQFPEDKLELFHARFAMGDRLKIEGRVIKNFGKNSTATQRTGRVVIATQVVEQSLDLDFDLLISDLAPIDLLIQRAGRLCRHSRDIHGDPISDVDQRGTPCLVVHGPEPVEDASKDWFSAYFPRASAVYPDHAQLWLTAWLLCKRGGFSMPEDARDLIEGVYGEAGEKSIPDQLLQWHFEVEGNNLADTSQARMNSINLDSGYAIEGVDWWNDAVTPTRLGEPSSTVRLARWDGRTLTPLCPKEFAWDRSQVNVRQALIKKGVEPADPALKAEVDRVLDTLPDKGKWSVLLPLTEAENGLWRGSAFNGRDEAVEVFYDS